MIGGNLKVGVGEANAADTVSHRYTFSVITMTGSGTGYARGGHSLSQPDSSKIFGVNYILVTRSGTAQNLYCGGNTVQGNGRSAAGTLQYGQLGSETNSTLTASINGTGSEQQFAHDTTHKVPVVAGDGQIFAFEIVETGPSNLASMICTFEVVSP